MVYATKLGCTLDNVIIELRKGATKRTGHGLGIHVPPKSSRHELNQSLSLCWIPSRTGPANQCWVAASNATKSSIKVEPVYIYIQLIIYIKYDHHVHIHIHVCNKYLHAHFILYCFIFALVNMDINFINHPIHVSNWGPRNSYGIVPIGSTQSHNLAINLFLERTLSN